MHITTSELGLVARVANAGKSYGSGAGAITALGMVNNLSLGVMQRSRELGLLRALGVSTGQLRLTILAESAQLAAAASLTGLVLGVFYGWAGAQSLLGSVAEGSLIAPSMPWPVIVAVD